MVRKIFLILFFLFQASSSNSETPNSCNSHYSFLDINKLAETTDYFPTRFKEVLGEGFTIVKARTRSHIYGNQDYLLSGQLRQPNVRETKFYCKKQQHI